MMMASLVTLSVRMYEYVDEPPPPAAPPRKLLMTTHPRASVALSCHANTISGARFS